jgi:hypothetical protein
MPAPLLIASLPKVLLYQYAQYLSAREAGIGGTFRRAIGSFLRMLRGTLRKRRRAQGDRATPVSAFRSQLRTEYPLQTRFRRRPR